ncbi:MAG: TIGR03857 family LLM class F420-dependent oxidoreductase [Pseudomonadota bacterium]
MTDAVTDAMTDSPYPEHCSAYPELGFYALPGHSRSPRDALRQTQDAEQLGIGNVMISERADYKEIAALCGAIAAVTESITIGTSATNQNTRHPVITASMGSTLNRLSNGRFALGLAKGVNLRWKAMGLPTVTYEREREFVSVLKRLWRGETITAYEGALGSFAQLSLAPYINEDIPILYVGFGPKSLEHAGRYYDGVHLHTFMGRQALETAIAQVRAGEAAAGRPRGSVKVWTVLATGCEIDDKTYLKYIIARLVTYLQIPGYGDMLAQINGWDADDVARLRTSKAVQQVGGLVDSVASLSQLAEIEPLVPEHWREAALGTPNQCAARWQAEFDAGADGVIIHASTPEQFEPVLTAYAQQRNGERFAGRTNRPA